MTEQKSPLTAADLSRIRLDTIDGMTAANATDYEFRVWLQKHLDGWFNPCRYTESMRVLFANQVNDRHPIVLTAHPGEDGRL